MRPAAWAAMCGLSFGCVVDSASLSWGPLASETCSPRYRVTTSMGPAREVTFEPRARTTTAEPTAKATATLNTADGRAVQRQIWSTPIAVGPASPDTPCRTQPIDPVESMLAVGWPTLPGARTRVGDAWQGRKPEGICNALACETRDCVADPWAHRFEALERAADGAPIGVVSTEFGGHGSGTARIDLAAGRLIAAEASLSPPARPGADEPPAPWWLRVEFLACAR